MKPIRTLIVGLLALCFALIFTGCQSTAKASATPFSVIQAALDQILPDDFEGDLKAAHDGFYFGTSVHLDIDLRGLKKVNNRWRWASGGYKRSGFFSQGSMELTPAQPK